MVIGETNKLRVKMRHKQNNYILYIDIKYEHYKEIKYFRTQT